MLDKAEAGIWEDVISLEAERREQMNAYFSAEESPPDAIAAMKVGIETIQKLDAQLMQLGQTQKKELSRVLQEFGQGKKAIQAYSH
jgi:plasmid stability protein